MLLLKLALNFTASFPWTSFLGQAKASQLVSTFSFVHKTSPLPHLQPHQSDHLWSPKRGKSCNLCLRTSILEDKIIEEVNKRDRILSCIKEKYYPK